MARDFTGILDVWSLWFFLDSYDLKMKGYFLFVGFLVWDVGF